MERLNKKEAVDIFKNMPFLELGRRADSTRARLHPERIVTFVIDRNINYTNICINQCRFCAFYRSINDPDAYLLDKKELFEKIRKAIKQGGTQILIQGGLHPELDILFYVDILKAVKERFRIHIHGFSPPEIMYMAKRSSLTIRETLTILKDAGLDSIPGGGAEILSDKVREVLSPKKIKASEWIMVMEKAHQLGMKTTATMMFGSIETPEDIVEHLDSIRGLQDRTGGFTAFIPWSFQPGNTALGMESEDSRSDPQRRPASGRQNSSRTPEFLAPTSELNPATGVDYLRVVAFSRIYLDNVPSIQASWVTQGLKMAQVALRFGANDFGSTMIEENVVKAAGISYRVSKDDIINAIQATEFQPAQRNTYYQILKYF